MSEGVVAYVNLLRSSHAGRSDLAKVISVDRDVGATGPAVLPGFLKEVQLNLEQMRLVAQALADPALKGGELANVSPSSPPTGGA